VKFSEKINFEIFFVFDLKTTPNLILLDRFLPLNTTNNQKTRLRYLLIISCPFAVKLKLKKIQK